MTPTQTIAQILIAAALIALSIFFFRYDCEGWRQGAALLAFLALLFTGTLMAWSTFYRVKG